MKNILLVFASPKAKKNYINVFPPIGILSLAAYLEKNGFYVDIIDCNIKKLVISEIKNYDLVGFSINAANIENSIELIKAISSIYPDISLVVGGPLPSVSPDTFFSLPVKAIFVSEAEDSLLTYLKNTECVDNKGYYFKDRTNRWVFNGRYSYIENLDKLPFPALGKIDLRRYYTPIKKRSPISVLISSRGCPFACTFCCKILGDKFRARSAKNVVDEIEWQVSKLQVKEIIIYDDNFTLDKNRASQICDLIIKRGIRVKLQLTNGVRVDTLDEELLGKMKSAGVWMIALAPESGNESTLQKIKKGFNLLQVEMAVKMAKGAGLKVWAFFMLGFPWENEDMVEKTIRFAKKINPHLAQFSVVTAFPGTELYREIYPKYISFYPNSKDVNIFSNESDGLFNKKVNHLITKAYRRFYFTPGKLRDFFSVFSLSDIIVMAVYTIKMRWMA